MSLLPTPSDEQEQVIENVLQGKNIIVDSVAGAGKTSTILLLANAIPNKNILILTYNKRLKFETKFKINSYGIKNAFVYSYHSFCNNIYSSDCINDYGIIKILSRNIPLKGETRNYEIIIIDEAQDMSKLYFELVCKIYKDLTINLKNKQPQICVFGDKYQSIFQFNGADERYIIYADTLLEFNKYQWAYVNLSTSYRITQQMAETINLLFLKSNRLGATKNIPNSMNYVICNTFMMSKTGIINIIIKKLLETYNFDDIFILCPSLKSLQTPPRLLSNYLSSCGYPIFLPNSDNDAVSDNLIKNKIAFSTFHQVKGLERKIVFVYNFDSTFNKFYDKSSLNQDTNYIEQVCPNVLYVAMTRATEKLYLIHHSSNDFLSFIDKEFVDYTEKLPTLTDKLIDNQGDNIILESIVSYGNMNIIKVATLTDTKDNEYVVSTGITDFIKFLPIDLVDKFYNSFTIKRSRVNKKQIIKFQTTSTQQGIYNSKNNIQITLNLDESVSSITGIAIPLYYETCCKRSILNTSINLYMMSQGLTKYNDTKDHIIKRYNTLIQSTKPKDSAFFLEVANLYSACVSNSIGSLNQITNYNWLPNDTLEIINKRMKKFLKVKQAHNYKFEHYLFYNFIDSKNRIIQFNGSIDCLDLHNNIVYEFKCTNELLKEHYLQTVIYHYVYSKLINNIWWLHIGNKIKVPSVVDLVEIIYYDKNQIHVRKKNTQNTTTKIVMALDNKFIDNINKLNPFPEQFRLPFRCKLFNALSNETCEINYDMIQFEQLINMAIDYKYSNNKKINDLEFININLNIKKSYITL